MICTLSVLSIVFLGSAILNGRRFKAGSALNKFVSLNQCGGYETSHLVCFSIIGSIDRCLASVLQTVTTGDFLIGRVTAEYLKVY
jgi:hypothetical protein